MSVVRWGMLSTSGIGRVAAAALADEAIDAVYVPLPIASHTEWTIKALWAGKARAVREAVRLTAADAAARFDAAEALRRAAATGQPVDLVLST